VARPDGLPHPVTTGDAFLAAILEEIRAIRKGGPSHMEPDSRQLLLDEVQVKEPAKSKKKWV
jgi:hypothetical protein